MELVIAKKKDKKGSLDIIDGIKIINVKDSLFCIKRLLNSEKRIVIGENTFVKEKTKRYLKKYEPCILKEGLCILDKVLKKVLEINNKEAPVKEIFVIAEPVVASQIIMKIKNLSRLFTVVSPLETLGKMYDELYFKFGTIIRHIPTIKEGDWENTIVIKKDETQIIAPFIKCPIITFDKDEFVGENIIRMREICVFDEEINPLAELLETRGSLYMYQLLEKFPNENTDVDLSEKPQKMFYLDTERK